MRDEGKNNVVMTFGVTSNTLICIYGGKARVAAAQVATYIDLAWGRVHGRKGMPSLGTIRGWLAAAAVEPKTWEQ